MLWGLWFYLLSLKTQMQLRDKKVILMPEWVHFSSGSFLSSLERTTSESQIGVSVLMKATLIIVWSVVMRFNTLIKTLVQNCFLDNCFVACLFLLIIAAARPWLTNRPILSHIPLSSTQRNQITPWTLSLAVPFSTKRHNWHTLVIVLPNLVLALT